MKIAYPVKVINGNLLIRSVRSKEECHQKGYQYEWEINFASFIKDKANFGSFSALSLIVCL